MRPARAAAGDERNPERSATGLAIFRRPSGDEADTSAGPVQDVIFMTAAAARQRRTQRRLRFRGGPWRDRSIEHATDNIGPAGEREPLSLPATHRRRHCAKDLVCDVIIVTKH